MFRSALLLALLAAPDFLARLGTTPQAAEAAVFAALTEDRAACPGDWRAVPYAARPQVASAAVAFARAFVKTEAFRGRYLAWWKAAQPQAPQPVEEIEAQEAQAEQEHAAQAERARLDLTRLAAQEKDPELKRAYVEALAAQSRMKKELESPALKAGVEAARRQSTAARRAELAEAVARHQAELLRWKALEDPAAAVRRGLDDFLALSATVDFKAATALRGGKVVFVDAELEDRPARWKQLFRAGPEVVSALRAAAQAWRAEL